MPNEDTETDDGREVAASVFEMAAAAGSAIAPSLPDPFRAAAVIGASLASLTSKLVRSIGTDNTAALIEELQRRRDEGKITDAHVARDDAEIAEAVSAMFADS